MKITKRRILGAAAALAALGVFGLIAVNILLWRPLIFAGSSEIVRVEGGEVRGLSWRGLSVYRGIPFAAPPVGEKRWRAPEAVIPWEGVRDATEFADVCMQSGETVPGLGIEPMGEDCLYLNVWTPAASAAERLPVMVWLYGGGLHVGSGSARLYWGNHLARKGVVVVTLNYRLGAFGMMAHPALSAEASYGASGNYVHLDQIAALRWVQRNIVAFGGDPSNVTIFGQSGGATSVSRLMVSPLARGLFHRAVAQSGGDMRAEPGTISLQVAERIGVEFAAELGAETLEELRAIPAEEILAADVAGYFDNGTPVGPHKINVDGVFLHDTVAGYYEMGRTDGSIAGGMVPLLLGFNKGDDPAQHPEAAINWAEQHARYRAIYAYYFSRVPPYPPFRFRGVAGHGAELIYLFGFPPPIFFYAVEFPWNAARDAEISDAMITYWTNFARTGNPNGGGFLDWPEYGRTNMTLEIGDEFRTLPLAEAVVTGMD